MSIRMSGNSGYRRSAAKIGVIGSRGELDRSGLRGLPQQFESLPSIALGLVACGDKTGARNQAGGAHMVVAVPRP